MDLELDPSLLPERYFVNIWHILQESFSNIEKYSHAHNVSVALGVRDWDICLTITDDGVMATALTWQPPSWTEVMTCQT